MVHCVKRSNIEPLLSGNTAEDLGIIKFSPKTEKDNAQVQSIGKNKKNNSNKSKHYLTKYPSVFHGVGTLKNYEVRLFVDESVRTVAEPPRPIPFHLKDRCDQELEKTQVEGIIELHTGPAPWVSNLVVALKDDANIRITVDMRNVNKAIQNTRIPIPKVNDIKAKLSGSKFFTKLDLKSEFHQLTLAENNRYLTVFHGKGKLWRYKKPTMGNLVASGELSKAFRPHFTGIKHVHVIHDDLIIAAPAIEEHDIAVEHVLELCQNLGLTLNPEKCIFRASEVPFWGIRITDKGIMPDPNKVDALQKAETPKNKE